MVALLKSCIVGLPYSYNDIIKWLDFLFAGFSACNSGKLNTEKRNGKRELSPLLLVNIEYQKLNLRLPAPPRLKIIPNQFSGIRHSGSSAVLFLFERFVIFLQYIKRFFLFAEIRIQSFPVEEILNTWQRSARGTEIH